MKKILFVSIDPVENRRRILNQIEVAESMGYQINVVAIETGQQTEFPFNLEKVSVPFTSGPLKFLFFNLKLLFKILFRKYEIIQLRGLWVAPAIIFRQIFNRSTIIYDAHEYFPGLGVYQERKSVKAFWMWFEKRIVAAAENCITVSEPIAELYKNRYSNLKDIKIIRNVPPYRSPKKPEQSDLVLNSEKPVILFHGYFMEGRGLTNLVQAMQDVANARLLLVGSGALEKELKQLVSDLKLEDKIHFREFIPYEHLIDFASQATIAATLLEPISDNHKYALPNKLFEYLMAGVPVLAGNTKTMLDYIPKYNVGITVDPTNPIEIANGINEMLSNKGRLELWKKNCLAAAKELCWEQEKNKLQHIYQTLI